MDEDQRQALRIELSRCNQEYWKWDECKWGTHRVNCLPGGCPFRVYSRDGRVIREEISCTYPNFSDSRFTVPDFNPRGCQKGQQHSRAMYGPDRVLHPMKRSGERGAGKWEPISWEQAFAEIGDKLAGVIQKYGPQSLIDEHCSNGASVIRGGAEGTVGAITSLLGGVSYDTDALGCDFNRGQYLTFNQYHHTAGIEALFLPDPLFVLSNPVYANIPDMHFMLEARRLASDTEAHPGRLRSHPQAIHHTHELRIRFVVEYDEAGVDCVFDAVVDDVDSVGVPADIVSRFEDGDVVSTMQMPCGGHAGNSSSNDCDFH